MRTVLVDLGVEEGEIAFPEPAARADPHTICFVSETIGQAAAICPTQARQLQDTLRGFRVPLEGRSIRLETGSVSLFTGDSGAFLMALGEEFLPRREGSC